MKNYLFIGLFLCGTIFNAQKLSDYKYVYVPKDIKEFEGNQYKLNSDLVKRLKAKGYEVIQEDERDWPEALKQNRCNVAIADLKNTSNIFKIKLTFEAKDCNNNVLFTEQGISSSKLYEVGYPEALQKSFVKVLASAPTAEKTAVTNIAAVQVPIKEQNTQNSNVATVEKTAPVEIQTVSTKSASNYSNKNQNYQKVMLNADQFILVAANSSTPFATFKNSTKEGVYRVQLADGTSTLGYTENGNYVIEMPAGSGAYTKEIFTAN